MCSRSERTQTQIWWGNNHLWMPFLWYVHVPGSGKQDNVEIEEKGASSVSFGASRAKADRPCGLSQAWLRQTAAIKPWLFQVHRVWKGLIEGLWSQWGWSFSPLPPLSLSVWKVGEGPCRERGVMGCRRHVTSFLLCGLKWNLDKNTPLVAACFLLHLCHIIRGQTLRPHCLPKTPQKSDFIIMIDTRESFAQSFTHFYYSRCKFTQINIVRRQRKTHQSPKMTVVNHVRSDLWLQIWGQLLPAQCICLRPSPLRSLSSSVHLIKTREGEEAPLQSFSHVAKGQVQSRPSNAPLVNL